MRDEKGLIIVWLLLLLSLLASWAAMTLATTRSHADYVSAINDTMRAESQNQSLLTHALSKLYSASSHSGAVSLNALTSSVPSIIELSVNSSIGQTTAESVVVAAVKKQLRPDWQKLALSLTDAFPCDEWRNKTTIASPFESARDCQNLSASLNSSYFIHGNLDLSSPLIISPDSASTMPIRIVVAGSVRINSPLKIVTTSKSLQIELIAFGEIELSSVISDNLNQAQLLLHSSKGNVKINTAPSNSELCQAGSAKLKLSIFADQNAKLGSAVYPSGVLGCDYVRDIKYWPQVKVLR